MSAGVPQDFYETSLEYRDRLESRRADEQWFAHLYAAVLSRSTSSSRLLDCGCGTGVTTSHVHKFRPDVTGVDFSNLFITEARKYGDYFEVMDMARLTFDSASFDVVFSADAIEHVSDLERVLSEMHRVLKAGGYLVLQAPNLSCGLLSTNYPRRPGCIFRRGWYLVHDLFSSRLKTIHEFKLETLVGDQDAVNLISPIWLKRRLAVMGYTIESLTTFALYFKPGPALATVVNVLEKLPLARLIGGRILLVARKAG